MALEEKWPELREEERKPLVHLDLRPVRLDLREVGVIGEVERQVRGDAVLEVESALRLALLAEAAGVRVERTDLDRREGRQELEVPAGRQPVQPIDQTHL